MTLKARARLRAIAEFLFALPLALAILYGMLSAWQVYNHSPSTPAQMKPLGLPSAPEAKAIPLAERPDAGSPDATMATLYRLPYGLIDGMDSGSIYTRRAFGVGIALGVIQPKPGADAVGASWFGCVSKVGMLFLSKAQESEDGSPMMGVRGCVYSLAFETPEHVFCVSEERKEGEGPEKRLLSDVSCKRQMVKADPLYGEVDAFCSGVSQVLPIEAIRDAIRDMCY